MMKFMTDAEAIAKIFKMSLKEANEKSKIIHAIREEERKKMNCKHCCMCKVEEMTSFKLNEEIKKLKSKNEKLKADVEYLTDICHKEGYRV